MNGLLSADEDVPDDQIDEYSIIAKQSMVESLLIVATAYLRQENRDAASPFIRKARK